MGEIELKIKADVNQVVMLHENGVFDKEQATEYLNQFKKSDLIEDLLSEKVQAYDDDDDDYFNDVDDEDSIEDIDEVEDIEDLVNEDTKEEKETSKKEEVVPKKTPKKEDDDIDPTIVDDDDDDLDDIL